MKCVFSLSLNIAWSNSSSVVISASLGFVPREFFYRVHKPGSAVKSVPLSLGVHSIPRRGRYTRDIVVLPFCYVPFPSVLTQDRSSSGQVQRGVLTCLRAVCCTASDTQAFGKMRCVC